MKLTYFPFSSHTHTYTHTHTHFSFSETICIRWGYLFLEVWYYFVKLSGPGGFACLCVGAGDEDF